MVPSLPNLPRPKFVVGGGRYVPPTGGTLTLTCCWKRVANQDARRKTQHTGHNESRKRHQTLLKTLWMTVMRTTGRENYYIKQEPVLLSNEEPRARTDALALRGHSNSGKHLQLSFRKSRYRGSNVTCKSEKCYSDHWRENLQTPAALAAAAQTTGRATHH